MDYKKNRFLTQEKLDIEAFQVYANLCPKNYAVSAETPYGTICDVISQNETGGTVLTEIKARKGKPEDYEDIFLEPSKWNNLMKLWRNKGLLPVFLNVFEDSHDMAIWILPQIKQASFHPNVLIYGSEEVDRIGLSWKSAYYFKYVEATGEYTIIKPEKEYIKKSIPAPRYYDSSILNNVSNETLFNL